MYLSRRSGKKTLYLPDNDRTCCPAHSIRLPILHFNISKSQKKKLKKWCNVLNMPLKDFPFIHPEQDHVNKDTLIHLPIQNNGIIHFGPSFMVRYSLFFTFLHWSNILKRMFDSTH